MWLNIMASRSVFEVDGLLVLIFALSARWSPYRYRVMVRIMRSMSCFLSNMDYYMVATEKASMGMLLIFT